MPHALAVADPDSDSFFDRFRGEVAIVISPLRLGLLATGSRTLSDPGSEIRDPRLPAARDLRDQLVQGFRSRLAAAPDLSARGRLPVPSFGTQSLHTVFRPQKTARIEEISRTALDHHLPLTLCPLLIFNHLLDRRAPHHTREELARRGFDDAEIQVGLEICERVVDQLNPQLRARLQAPWVAVRSALAETGTPVSSEDSAADLVRTIGETLEAGGETDPEMYTAIVLDRLNLQDWIPAFTSLRASDIEKLPATWARLAAPGPDAPSAPRPPSDFGDAFELYNATRGPSTLASDLDRWLRDPAQQDLRRILDPAAGTGIPAQPLLALGHDVTVTDGSEEMGALYRQNATRYAAVSGAIDPVKWADLSDHLAGQGIAPFDLLYVLGNSFSYGRSWAGEWTVSSIRDLLADLSSLHGSLRPGGRALIDWSVLLHSEGHKTRFQDPHPTDDQPRRTIDVDERIRFFPLFRCWDVHIRVMYEGWTRNYTFRRYSSPYTANVLEALAPRAGFSIIDSALDLTDRARGPATGNAPLMSRIRTFELGR